MWKLHTKRFKMFTQCLHTYLVQFLAKKSIPLDCVGPRVHIENNGFGFEVIEDDATTMLRFSASSVLRFSRLRLRRSSSSHFFLIQSWVVIQCGRRRSLFFGYSEATRPWQQKCEVCFWINGFLSLTAYGSVPDRRVSFLHWIQLKTNLSDKWRRFPAHSCITYKV